MRLQDTLMGAQSDAAAAAVSARDRSDALAGECAALKAELHGASLEKSSALEELGRLRRRMEEAEERASASSTELHALRLESTDALANRGKVVELEAASAVAQEKLQMQLAFSQKEAAATRAQAAGDVQALATKLKHVKKLAAKERTAAQQADVVRVRQIDALKREVQRLRGEREQLRRDARTRGPAAMGGGSPFSAVPSASGGAPAGGALLPSMSNELRSMLAASVAAESALAEEASALNAACQGAVQAAA